MTAEYEFIQQRAQPEQAQQLRAVTKTTPLLPAEIHKRGNAYAHTKTGPRADLGINLRSGWEANIARVFLTNGIAWEFEPTHFPFPIKRGIRGYVPDFYLPVTEEWVEVKGYLDTPGRTKLKRFRKYYPQEFSQLVVITGPSKDALAFFEELEVPCILTYGGFRAAFKESIPNWEGL